MKLRDYFFSAIALGSLLTLLSCANPEIEPSNTIRVSNLPAMNLQLAQEYEKQLPLYDEAMQRGYIDEGFYIVQRNKTEQAVKDQLDMYEGGVREQTFGCHSGGGTSLSYLFFEPAQKKPASLPYSRVTR